jgi:hypothetical protein
MSWCTELCRLGYSWPRTAGRSEVVKCEMVAMRSFARISAAGRRHGQAGDCGVDRGGRCGLRVDTREADKRSARPPLGCFPQEVGCDTELFL